MPTEVKNSIEDVFDENESIDDVICYHIDDYEEFQKDLKLENKVKLYFNGNNEGIITDVWTYYGEVYHSLSEDISLYGDDEKIFPVEISKIENAEPTYLSNINSYAVILHEITEWKTSEKIDKKRILFIYCPVSLEEEPQEDRYDKIYDQLMKGR